MKSIVLGFVLLLVSSVAWADLKDDVNILSVSHKVTARRGDSIQQSIKIDVQNAGTRGDITLIVSGKNSEGFKIKGLMMRSRFEANETKSLSEVEDLNQNEFSQITKWEVTDFWKDAR